ncbi:MAG TPA: DUF4382 domain-containing protein [Solimonas sp.]|nr:DUF4382 domain-containing protein [Solimonas sp.]
MSRFLPCVIPFLVLLAGCEASLDVDLTDGPLDGADAVVLRVEGIDLLREDGNVVSVETEATDVDFLQYRNGTTLRLVEGAEVPAARYTGVRLRLAGEGSYLSRNDGGEVPVEVPEDGDFASADLSIGDEDEAGLLLDLELRLSLDDESDTSGSYRLTPVLRAMEADSTGTVAGVVADSLVEDDSCRGDRALLRGVAVYAWAGHGATPVDYARDDSLRSQPLSVAAVYDDGDQYRYRFSYLPEGSYTLALTCDADAERPASADELGFIRRRNVTAAQGETASIDFTAD